MRLPLAIIFIAIAILAAACASFPFSNTKTPEYGKRFYYRQDEAITFPDFTIMYAGLRENGFFPGTARRLAPLFVFIVSKDNIKQELKYSAGTGEIAPVFFVARESCFQLELEHSQTLGILKENEAVVSLAPIDFCPKSN